jgi:hypothetical protein
MTQASLIKQSIERRALVLATQQRFQRPRLLTVISHEQTHHPRPTGPAKTPRFYVDKMFLRAMRQLD